MALSMARLRSRTIRAVLVTKFAAMDSDDGALLASVYSPRAMTYTVLEGRLGVSPTEWSARFDAPRAAGTQSPRATHRIVSLDSEGDEALARLEHVLPDAPWIDYASRLKVGGTWKIVGPLYARQGGAS